MACEAEVGRDPDQFAALRMERCGPLRVSARTSPKTDVAKTYPKEDGMKKIVLALAALGTLAATPVFAQGFDIRVGGDRDRAVFRDHDRDRDFREEGFRHRGFREEGFRHREWRGSDCRMTIIRDRRPDGSVMVRKIRRCG
jgi:hypothetical protein